MTDPKDQSKMLEERDGSKDTGTGGTGQRKSKEKVDPDLNEAPKNHEAEQRRSS